MGLPESLSYLLLVVLGFSLTRIVDLVVDWQRNRLRGGADPDGNPTASLPQLSATARQRVMERRAVYARFRASVSDTVHAAVAQGQGTYGMLYQIRDTYGDLLRIAPTQITQAADSVIRCVTLLVNLGPSDQRFAMFTRALNLFDEECECDQGVRLSPAVPPHREYSVLGDDVSAAMAARLPDAPPTKPASLRTGSDSASVRART